MDVLYNSYYYTTEESSFICWVNQQDSVYTLFLRQTTPDSDKNIVVFSDTGQIANPSIAFINSANVNNVRIAWQTLINDHWQILLREYLNDSLTTIVPLTDSLEDNINPVLNSAYIAWIQNGNLIYKNLDSINAKPIILDTLDCSNPKISKFSDDYPNIIYEKGPAGNTQIYEANYMYNYYSGSEWKFIKVSKSGNNINPAIDPDGISVVYQEFENGVWKIVESLVWLDTTDNLSYNCENPVIFAYPLITKISTYVTPFFIVYTSDSVKNNVQIFLKTEYYIDTTINLSNAEGNNYLPHISLFISQQDTPYIAIYWIHDQNGKKDIWRAYSKYYPDLSPVINRVLNLNNFALNQNYPNPFNPSTVISWQLAKTGIITLKV
jgi:hypothetical protein